jgi:DNA-binding ferritin-like protein
MLEELHAALERIYGTNFVAYQRAHTAHMNTRGRTFYQDHKLLKKIYLYLQSNVDVLGEKIQACGLGAVPISIGRTCDLSAIIDLPLTGTSDDLLEAILEDLYALIEVYHEVDRAGQAANYPDVSNMAADHIGVIAAFAWRIEATLELPGRHHERTTY